MNAILALPLGVRLGGLFLLGLVVGGFVNLSVYRLAWSPRSISPWSSPPKGAAQRGWRDRLPVLGWFALARESALHGRGFWIRPLVVELITALLLAGLYLWEVHYLALYSFVRAGAPPATAMLAADFQSVIHAQYLSHAVLALLMLVASLIDLDEQTIPDTITIPGTLLGLTLATWYPWSLLPAETWLVGRQQAVEFATLVSPHAWPQALGGWPRMGPLVLAIGCWTLWCGGILPRRLRTRRGWLVGLRVVLHRWRVERLTYGVALMWFAGTCAITAAAIWAPRAYWAALLTALVGIAVGGGLIWIVRAIGSATLGREAMGFGDVMLMSMIGAFIGWQGSLVVFFLAPLFGLVNGVVQWTIHRQNEIPYGPYLCLATLFVILKWTAVWDWGYDLFALGGLLAGLLAVCFLLMGGMLFSYGKIRQALTGRT